MTVIGSHPAGVQRSRCDIFQLLSLHQFFPHINGVVEADGIDEVRVVTHDQDSALKVFDRISQSGQVAEINVLSM
jgi:hypothetical protein